MAQINISGELELEIREFIDENKQKIIQFKKPIHKKPSIPDAIFFLLKNHKYAIAFEQAMLRFDLNDKELKEQMKLFQEQIKKWLSTQR